MTTLKLADGKVTVFNRLESPYWQVIIQLKDRGSNAGVHDGLFNDQIFCPR